MLRQQDYDCKICSEFDSGQKEDWFYSKQKKFMHSIDTFYYSVTFTNDFSKDTEDAHVLNLRSWFLDKAVMVEGFEDYVNVDIPGVIGKNVLYRPYTFSKYYKYCLEVPEEMDIFIASSVPSDQTAQMVVQLRSTYLWMTGVRTAVEESFEIVQKIAAHFHLQIFDVKENRIDYCWHTNAIQNPASYFRPDKFARMEVSQFKDGLFHYRFKKDKQRSLENDYIALGRRGGNCFVRIYLKSKEVVEMKYKPFFLKMWQLNGMISRYDFYTLENAALDGNWKAIDRYRLMFYRDFGKDKYYTDVINKLLSADEPDYVSMYELAEMLTPPVTSVVNVEFQTSRKSSKSYKLLKLRDNSDKGVSSRLYDYLDNWRLITDYLTHHSLRLVDINCEIDGNYARAPYTDFWHRLRGTKPVDDLSTEDQKLVREYHRELNKAIVKRRMCNSIITYSLYCKGKNSDSVHDDVMAAIMRLNDNDIKRMKAYKEKQNHLLPDELLDGTVSHYDISNYSIIDINTGEFYEYDSTDDKSDD